jgi:signal transduction histidine kinase
MTPRSLVLAERLERLVRGGKDLTGETSLDRVLQRVADLCLDVAGARFAAVGLLAPDRRSLETFVTAGLSSEARALIGPVPKGKGLLGTVIHEGRPMRLDRISDHPESAGFPPNHPPMESFLGVPVPGTHGILGNLYVTEKTTGGHFTEEDEHLMVLLAGMAASAVENARHHEESARLLTEVQGLLRSRERFFAMVNHELRNALAGVYGWAEMLVRRKDPSTVPKAAFEVLESAETAVALINDLLDLSRLDEDRLKPVLQDVDCGVVLRRAVTRVTPAASAKQVQVEICHGDEIRACRTDAHRVEQILVNLLTNAIRHTPPHSTVQVTLGESGSELLVSVLDQGSGIAADNLERVFDVYYTKPGEEGRGMGLGLPLSRRLARLLGGDLVAGNQSSGGAAFTLRLPLLYSS